MYLEEQTEDIPELDINFLPQEYLHNKENNAEFLHMLKELPSKQQELLYLYYYIESTVDEIAQLHNCSADAVYKTLQRARKALKSKLEAKGKTYKALTGASLSALFLMEEQIFVANYLTALGTSTATAAIVTTVAAEATAKSATAYVIAGIITTACVVTGTIYFALQPEQEIYDTYEPQAIIQEEAEELAFETISSIIDYYIEKPEPEETPPPNLEEEYKPEPEMPEYSEPIEEHPVEEAQPELVEQTTPEPPEAPAPTSEPAYEAEPETYIPEHPTPEEEYEPETPQEPEPIIPIDRTDQILASLAIATTNEAVDQIISYYDFVLITQMHRGTGKKFWFYVTNEGSGDILIGITSLEDSTDWNMRFEHYPDGGKPLDSIELLQFMD